VAKGGARRRQRIVDPALRALVETLKERHGRGGLLAYRENGRWSDLRSSDVNDYIAEVAGDGFTAKDFRTWHATVLAAVAVAVRGAGASSTTARRQAIRQAVADVAGYLGNTPAVCRASYVDPRVFERFEGDDVTIRAGCDDLAALTEGGGALRRRVETAVLELLAG
jgi:DNA topoisomerase IB